MHICYSYLVMLLSLTRWKPNGNSASSCDEHLLSLEELSKKHGTSLNFAEPHLSKGITQGEADKRLAEFGPNQMTPPKGLPEWVKLLLKASAYLIDGSQNRFPVLQTVWQVLPRSGTPQESP